MLVCTFLVKESNPKAQPLPGFVRYVYPCLWYKSEPFVLPPIQYETDDDEQEQEFTEVTHDERVWESENQSSDPVDNSSNDTTDERCRRGQKDRETPSLPPFQRAVVLTASDTTGVSPTFSPVEREGVSRRDFESVHQGPSGSAEKSGKAVLHYSKASFTSPVKQLAHFGEEEDDVATETVLLGEMKRGGGSGGSGDSSFDAKGTATGASALSTRRDDDEDTTEDVHVEEEEVATVFGYREAFASPYTRFMLSQYMVLSAADMMVGNCFPIWAVATTDAGGLGLTTQQVSYLLLLNSAPCLVGNVLFRMVERYFVNRMGLMRVGVMGASIVVMLLPFNSYLGPSFWTYALVFLCTAGRQVFVSWCYSLNTMLTARSAPPGHVGSIMGINQSCGALVRGIVPFLAAPLFAWSISGHHVFPFNHPMVFTISSLMFFSVWIRSYSIRTDAECNLQMAP